VPPADWPLWTQILAGAGILAAALIAIIALLVKTGRGVKTAAAWVRGVVVDAITDVVKEHSLSASQITEIVEAKVGPIHAEVRPNGGASLKDQITRMDRLLQEHLEYSATDRADLRHWLERLDPGRLTHRPDHEGPSDEDGPSY
jgi:hypothetical protein